MDLPGVSAAGILKPTEDGLAYEQITFTETTTTKKPNEDLIKILHDIPVENDEENESEAGLAKDTHDQEIQTVLKQSHYSEITKKIDEDRQLLADYEEKRRLIKEQQNIELSLVTQNLSEDILNETFEPTQLFKRKRTLQSVPTESTEKVVLPQLSAKAGNQSIIEDYSSSDDEDN